MSAKIINQSETSAEFLITLSEEELKPHVQQAYDALRPKVKAAGFRPGKAPNMIVEREMGASVVQNEVIEQAVMHSYADAATTEKLPAIAPPEVSVKKFVPYTELEYSATVELMPPIKLPDYKKMSVKKPPAHVESADIDQTIQDLRKRLATKLEVQRSIKKADEVTFDFDGTKDGQPVQGASAKNYKLVIGSGSFIPGFEEELIGLVPKSKKVFDITFPKDYHEENLAGQKVQFSVQIAKVEEHILPEVDGAFVEQVSPFKTVVELRENITVQLQGEKNEQAARQYEQAILEELVQKSGFTPPSRLVHQQLGRLRDELSEKLAASGLDIDKYLQLRSQSAEDLDRELRPEAQKRVALAVLLTEVAKTENISVSNDDIEGELARLRDQYQDPQFQAELNNPSTREEIYNHLMASRVIAKLVEYTS